MRPDPRWAVYEHVDLRGYLPRGDNTQAHRPDDTGDIYEQPARHGGRDDRAQPREPLVTGERRPTGRTVDHDRRVADIHVRAHGGRQPGARRAAVLSRPPDGPDGTERLDGPGRGLHPGRAGRPGAGAP